MIWNIVAAQLAREAAKNLKHLKMTDLQRVVRAVRPARMLLLPSLGLFGAGVAVGTGIGMLTAPNSGKETRQRMLASMRNGYAKLTGNGGEREWDSTAESAPKSGNGHERAASA